MKMILEIIFLTMLGGTFGIFNEELQTRFQTMQSSEFLEYFNNQNYSWKMGQYNFNIPYTPMDLNDTHELNDHYDIPSLRFSEAMVNLPENFDARQKWPHCHTIGEIYNQHLCASCWAHGVANTASDRICIHTNKHVELSEQDLACSHPSGTICQTGSASQGFQFWKDHGLVTRKCRSYHPELKTEPGCVLLCETDTTTDTYFRDKHLAKEVYSIPFDPIRIKMELFLNGPIQASINVYQDLLDNQTGRGYTGGIYEYTYGLLQFHHSVRIIGYGVENGVDYLLAANTWGRDWGENGYVRIKLLQRDLFIDNMYSGIPEERYY